MGKKLTFDWILTDLSGVLLVPLETISLRNIFEYFILFSTKSFLLPNCIQIKL